MGFGPLETPLFDGQKPVSDPFSRKKAPRCGGLNTELRNLTLDLPLKDCKTHTCPPRPSWEVRLVLAEVRLQEGEPLENALRRFKRNVQQEDIIKEVKRHSFYLKPGEKRRVKEALARKRNRKKVRKEQD